jgi:superfamily II DNA or RNA helicase
MILTYQNGRISVSHGGKGQSDTSFPAYTYPELKVRYPEAEDRVFQDQTKTSLKMKGTLRPYQIESIDQWEKNGCRGIIVLPTAAGKTHIGMEAIARLSCSTIIIAPTIELITQWRLKLAEIFETEIGQIGGGIREIRDISVCTYDSAFLMADTLGNRFKFLLIDEVHHLASEQFRQIAVKFASPFRMGLTATYERTDKLHETLEDVMGGKIFEMGYKELSEYIADYKIVRLPVELTPEETDEYERNRNIFTHYLRSHSVKLGGPWDFEKFIMRSWSREGREALRAWRRSREIAFNSRVKIDAVRYVMIRHPGEKIIVFSEDTSTAYMISKEFLVPALTYLTPASERKHYLEMFKNGEVYAIAASRILDEGVDVPDASVAIVLSGSGSTRQFRQRLGRILRPGDSKKSTLYEVVTSGTSEFGTSKRRRKGVPDRIDAD